MRTVATSWTGLKWNNSNMTQTGNKDAEQFLNLFDLNGTLSEFNSPTYAGVSLYALTIAAKYISTDSVIGAQASRVIQQIWDYQSLLWNANMRNFAGPWDRSYGYDMNKYVAIMSEWIWTMVGRQSVWKQKNPIYILAHADDLEFAPLISVLSGFHRSLLSNETVSRFTTFSGEHIYSGHTYAPPRDLEQRNISTWLSENLTIGTVSFNQNAVGGFVTDRTSFSPSVVQWLRSDGSIGYFNLYPTVSAMKASVAPSSLTLTYPLGTSSSIFTFILASNPLGGPRDISSLSDVSGLNIAVTGGTVDPVPQISFCGLIGGSCSIIQ